MAQGNKPRHSRSTRKPVTIDLEPEDVKDDKKDSDAQDAKASAEDKTAVPEKTAAPADKAGDKPGEKADKPAAAAKAEQPAKTDAKDKADASAKPAAGSVPKSGAASQPPGKADSEKPKGEATRKSGADAAARAAPAAQQPPQKSGSGMRTFGVGVIAAVVAVAIFGGLQYAGVLQVPGNNSGGSAADIVAADVEALKQSVASLEQTAGSAAGDVSSALEGRVSALESSVSNAGSGSEDRLAALESKVESLASQGGGSTEASATNDAALKDLSDRIAALEKSLSDQQSSLQGVEGSVSSLGQKIASDEQSQDQTIKAIDDRLAAIEKTLEAPRQDIKVAQALAAASLKAAIDRGGPFMAELEAFASVDGDSPAIAQLRTLAASGVPSRATLLSRFPSVASAMIAAGDSGSESDGLFDHLLSSATSLVQVRPVGEVAGDSVEAIVARMETRLKNGDLQGALNEWNTLPQAAKDASQSYVNDLQARIEAEKLISGSLTAALPAAVRSGSEQSGGEN